MDVRWTTRRALLWLMLAAAAPALGSAGEEPSADPLFQNLTIRHDERGRFTIYEPKRRLWEPWEFMVYPVAGVNDDGGRWMNLRVKTKGAKRLGLKSLDVVLAGASSSFPLAIQQVEADASGCLGVAESVELAGEEDLIRRIAASQDATFTFRGIGPERTYRLTEADLAEFRRVVGLFEREVLPPPAATLEEMMASGASEKGARPPKLTSPVLVGRSRGPKFPRLALQEKRTGLVVLEAVIGEDGRISKVEVVSSTTHGCGFEEAAIEAVKAWRYKPGTKDGEPVEVQMTVPIDFGFRR